MAVPKRKSSKQRSGKRRANWKLALPGMSECPQCHKMKLSHRVCKNCGYYNGKQVITVEKDGKTKKEEKPKKEERKEGKTKKQVAKGV